MLRRAKVIDAHTPVFVSKQSRAFDRVMETAMPVHRMCAEVPLFAHAFREVATQLEALYRYFLTLAKQ